MPYKKRHHHSNIIGARKAAASQSRFRWCRGLVRPIDVLIARRIWFHVVFLHIRHHLVRDFGEHFLGKQHLTDVQIVAKMAAHEFTERHELSLCSNNNTHTHANTYMYIAIVITDRNYIEMQIVLKTRCRPNGT